MKQVTFASHVPCYVDPTGTGNPTYCKLFPWDHVQVFNTIKGAFLTELKATVGGGWDTAVACLKKGKKWMYNFEVGIILIKETNAIIKSVIFFPDPL